MDVERERSTTLAPPSAARSKEEGGGKGGMGGEVRTWGGGGGNEMGVAYSFHTFLSHTFLSSFPPSFLPFFLASVPPVLSFVLSSFPDELSEITSDQPSMPEVPLCPLPFSPSGSSSVAAWVLDRVALHEELHEGRLV